MSQKVQSILCSTDMKHQVMWLADRHTHRNRPLPLAPTRDVGYFTLSDPQNSVCVWLTVTKWEEGLLWRFDNILCCMGDIQLVSYIHARWILMLLNGSRFVLQIWRKRTADWIINRKWKQEHFILSPWSSSVSDAAQSRNCDNWIEKRLTGMWKSWS